MKELLYQANSCVNIQIESYIKSIFINFLLFQDKRNQFALKLTPVQPESYQCRDRKKLFGLNYLALIMNAMKG